MARIPDQELERLKREADLLSLVGEAGVELEQKGRDWHGLCPLHDDHEPSLVVTPERWVWHCFGCGKGGSAIDWVMAREGVGFRTAVERLQERFPPPVPVSAIDSSPKLPEEELESLLAASDAAILAWVTRLYHEKALSDSKASEYLASRGLEHPDLLSHFQLGYSDRSLGLRLPLKALKLGGAIREKLQRLGILRQSGHEHLAGRLVVPLYSLAGDVVQLYGRAITPNLRAGTPDHLYLAGERDCLLHPEAIERHEELILCEAPLDALTFWCAGFPNVTTCFGVHGFTRSLAEAMKRHGTRRVLIAFDRDDQGEKGAKAVAARLEAAGIEPYRVLFPRGMDANDYARKVTPAAKSLELVLRKAEWAGTGRPLAVQVPAIGPEPGDGSLGQKPPSLAASPPPAPEQLTVAEPSPATSLPVTPKLDIRAEVREQGVVIRFGDRRFRIRGFERNLSYDTLKVNLLAARGEGFHVDTLDLYSARQRAVFLKQAALELGVDEEVLKKDLGRVLLKLEELQEAQIRAALAPPVAEVELSDAEQKAALELLRSPDLLVRILEDFARCGVVGEETNKLVGYLAATSRKLPRPLAVVVQSSSSAGKSALMEAVLSLIPEEERVSYSAMTGQSLFYMGETDLRHKILAIAEEEGAERASYALKLLQSEGELTIASTGKDPATGKLVTHEYRVEGPVMIFLTTTAIDVDEELLNRCLVLSVDEAREQTRAIHRLQRERRTLEGLVARKEHAAVLTLHRNAQRLLRPLAVVNPFARELTFLDTRVRMRRDHEKYLTLIDAIALLHQHQRPVKRAQVAGGAVEYVEVTADDVEMANGLAHEVLGRSLDELPPQTRRLLELLDGLVADAEQRLDMARSDVRFSRREVRDATNWGDTQLRLHMGRLVEMEYLLVHQGHRGRSFVYELLWEAPAEGRVWHLPGLIDVAALRAGTTERTRGHSATSRGRETEIAPPTRAQRGPNAGGSRSEERLIERATSGENGRFRPENAHQGSGKSAPSYVESRRSEVSADLATLSAKAR